MAHPADVVVKSRDVMPEGALTLPAAYYIDAEFFRREMDGLFGQMWICAGRTEQVERPGQFFVRDVLGESIVITRAPSGHVNAFYNVCRHRGTRLCEEASGRFQETLQCPYHAWTYALDGRLVGAPHMDKVEGFEKADHSLNSVALGLWEGFIFLNLGKNPTPLEKAFAPLAGKFTHWNLPNLRSARRIEYDVNANWKLIFENYSECYHCPLVHRRSRSSRRTIPRRTTCAKGRSSAATCPSPKARALR